MDRLQSLSKKKLEIEIDYSKLQLAMEEERYWSRRNRLEKAYRDAYFCSFSDEEAVEKAKSELLTFYIMHGVRHKTIKEKET